MLTTINVTEECIRRYGNPIACAIQSVVREGIHVDASKSPIDICDGNGELARIYVTNEIGKILDNARHGRMTAPVSFQIDIPDAFLKGGSLPC